MIIIVGLHEAGHFFTAKFFKVKVDEFGFGFPPRIWGKKMGETIYSINAIPAGAFVRLFGEEGEGPKNPRSFAAKGPWVRAAIIAAGVVMNIIVAFVLFSLLLASGGFRSDMPVSMPFSGETIDIQFPFGEQQDGVLITGVLAGSPAEKAGLQGLDKVEAINGQEITSNEQLIKIINENKDKVVNVSLYNILDRKSKKLSVIPSGEKPADKGTIGIAIDKVVTIRYKSLAEKVFSGPAHSVNMLVLQNKAIGDLFGKAFREKTVAPVKDNLRGPIGIVALLGISIGSLGGMAGFWLTIQIVALISLILGVINILPIPALDGGRLFFTLFEGVTGRKVNEQVERLIHTVGFVVLILVFLVVSFYDIDFLIRFFR